LHWNKPARGSKNCRGQAPVLKRGRIGNEGRRRQVSREENRRRTMTEESKLTEKHCSSCEGKVDALAGEDLKRYASETPDWEIVDGHHVRRTLTFPDFVEALLFVNRIGEVAEREGHHPDISLSYGKVEVQIYTHAVDGLTENDFILASKIDKLEEKRGESAFSPPGQS
jgi:4a-hydroxytetrahydrobiopterin dehydratase